MNGRDRDRFDAILEQVLAELPKNIHQLLEQTPLIVDDRPSPELLAELGLDSDEETLCGLHSGIPLTERTVLDGVSLPETIHLFREGIIDEAGGWTEWVDEEGTPLGGLNEVRRQIRITLLHEIGHHFGLDEADLQRLGYE